MKRPETIPLPPLPSPVVALLDSGDAPAWGGALSLSERIDRWRQATSFLLNEQSPSVESSRVEQWRGLPAFQNRGVFKEKLERLHLSEAEFADLLGVAGACFEQGGASCPEWVATFSEAHRDFASAPLVFADDTPAEADFSLLLAVVNPLVAWGSARLRREIAAIEPVFPRRDVLNADMVERVWLASVRGRLASMTARVMALELNSARLENRLEGATPAERYRNFFTGLRASSASRDFWSEYSVLARQITECVQTSVAALAEFLSHLAHDWRLLETQFAGSERMGPLTGLWPNQGDSHGGGKGVVLAEFGSADRVVYKPRSLSTETHFQRLLQWLNAHGAEPALRTIEVVDCGDHGWVEFVTPQSCEAEEEVERFYRRQGELTALFYALQANDFHSQNLIAAGEYPVAIDLETLFQPAASRLGESSVQRLVRRAYEDSVMNIGLLPQRIWSHDMDEGIDISGIGGGGTQVAPEPTLCWAEPGTDRMHVTCDRFMIAGENNRPTLQEQDVSPSHYRRELRCGFVGMYRLLMEHRDALTAADGPLSWFAADPVRVVLRDTRTYAALLEASFHPDYLRNQIDRDQLFDALWLRTQCQPHLRDVIDAEQRDLRQRDIPLFTTRADSCDLWTSCGHRVVNFFPQSGLSDVTERLQRFSVSDLERQLVLIDASLATLGHNQGEIQSVAAPCRPSGRQRTKGELIEASKKAGDRLVQLAIRQEGMATWFGSRYAGDRWTVDLCGIDLYDGLSGIALFLAHLGDATGAPSYTELASEAFATVEAHLRDESYKPAGIGGFSGQGGMFYAAARLAELWRRPDLLDLAEEHVARLASAISADDQYDVVAGGAGCLLGLLNLYGLRRSPATLQAAIACGEHLLRAAHGNGSTTCWAPRRADAPPLAGYSHGAAGIADALRRLFQATGDQRYLIAARGAVEFERTLYSPDDQNWLDRRAGRTHGADGDGKCMTAWCHGAPGIGLARLRARDGSDAAMDGEIAAAVAGTLRAGFGHNQCLCHGDLGNLEFLFEASRALGDARLEDQVGQIAGCVVASIERDGYRCGTPSGQESPGLMNGLAGIGYGLLRLAMPDRVPSVLTLESSVGFLAE